MAERVDLGPVAGATDKRVVTRHAASIIEPQYLAGVTVRVLCAVASAPASRHEELAVVTEGDP
jgi:hypothetical protein